MLESSNRTTFVMLFRYFIEELLKNTRTVNHSIGLFYHTCKEYSCYVYFVLWIYMYKHVKQTCLHVKHHVIEAVSAVTEN